MPNSNLKTFVTIVDTGSLAETARQLKLSPSAISKQLSALEQRLGTQLIQRSTRWMQVTEAGLHFYKRCVEITRSLEAAESEVRDLVDAPMGTLKITMPEVLVSSDIASVLQSFTAIHPHITISLEITNDLQSLIQNSLDVGFRVGQLPDSGLIGANLFEANVVMCASPSYVKSNGVPATVEQLDNHQILVPSPIYLSPSDGSSDVITPRHEPERQLLCDNTSMLIELAKSGVGPALIWDYSAAAAIARGELQCFPSPIAHAPRRVSLVYTSRDFLPRRVRLFIEHVKNHYVSTVSRVPTS